LKESEGEFAAFSAARIHAQLGDTDTAFDALNRAWEARDNALLRLKVDPYLDPLRGDPRFAALLAKLDFPG
jgi:hypothetical protein